MQLRGFLPHPSFLDNEKKEIHFLPRAVQFAKQLNQALFYVVPENNNSLLNGDFMVPSSI